MKPQLSEPEFSRCPKNGMVTFFDGPPLLTPSCVPAPEPVRCRIQGMNIKQIIWRNGVLFTNLHRGHLGISMMDSNTTEYIEKKIIFKLSSHWQFGNISSSFGSVLYSIQNWKELVCLQNDMKLVVPFSFENLKRSFITKLIDIHVVQ